MSFAEAEAKAITNGCVEGICAKNPHEEPTGDAHETGDLDGQLECMCGLAGTWPGAKDETFFWNANDVGAASVTARHFESA